jgi:CubicO group peptidase (beta-lactamase class C family)
LAANRYDDATFVQMRLERFWKEGSTMRAFRTSFVVVFLLLGVILGPPATAQEPQPAEPETGEAPAIDVADLEAFLDGVIEGRMDSFNVAGVTVSVVLGGEMIFAKGYGYGDVAARRKVDPAVTLFRPGSISKTFTWTAAMQLFERGELDLDADIRKYLTDIQLPDTYSEPITMSHIMAHAVGFEDLAIGHLFGDDPNAVHPLKEYLLNFQPAQVREPGTLSSYSNYASALAGHVIANISGMPYEEYLERNIFEPLGMTNSTFREPWKNVDLDPMPARLLENSSNGYLWKNGGFEPGVFEFIHQVGPAGAMSTTAVDMSRWMLMHLGEGTLDGVQILAPETARLMHQRHFTHDEEINGWAHGFAEGRIGDYRAISHNGGTMYFESQMIMVPELGFGLFASSNTSGGMRVVLDLPVLVAKRYFVDDAESEPLKPPADFAERGKRFAGSYIGIRRPYTKVDKLPMLLMGSLPVSVTDDGYLVFGSGDSARRLVEVAPLTFTSVDGEGTIKFVEDDRGKIVGMIPNGPAYYDRPATSESMPAIVAVVVLTLLACLGVLIAAWYRRKTGIEQTTGERFANAVLIATAVVWILFLVELGFAFAGLAGGQADAMFNFPPSALVWALTIALAGVVLTVLSVVLLVPVWRKRSWTVGRRIRHTLVVLILVDLVLMLHSMNMIGFKYF